MEVGVGWGGERMRMTVEMILWSASTKIVWPSTWLLSQAQSDCAMEQYILRSIVSAFKGDSLFCCIPAAVCISDGDYSPLCLVLQNMKGVTQSSSFAGFYLLQTPGTHSQLGEQREVSIRWFELVSNPQPSVPQSNVSTTRLRNVCLYGSLDN